MNKDQFLNPPNEYKPAPFWGWNDRLERDEVIHQVQEFAKGGWGGFFIHARDGLITPYLGKEWMEMIRVAVEEGKRLGIKCWIYDEHPFPAGHAGGTVPILGEEYRNRVLYCKLDNRPLRWDGLVMAFSALEKGGEISNLQVMPDPASYKGDANLFFYFFEYLAPLGDTSCRGFSYIDALNPKAVKAFIDNTHNTYLKNLGAEIGDSVPGFYSDIPLLTWFYSAPKPSLPWTPALPGRFKEQKGYNLLEHLPSLLFDLGDYMKVRHDFWDLVTDMFVESYSKQVYDWCEEHGCIFTGHYWGEETLHWQPCWAGAIMPHLEYNHWPGTDHIGRFQDDPLGIKQVDSVVCQLGKERLQTETYAMSGPGLSFIDRKWVGDWEVALGTTFMVNYIPTYSLRGVRKRDEPPSDFYHQPYWPYNRMLSDYYTRLSYALTQGKRVVDVLLLEPMSSIWSIYRNTGETPAAMRPMPNRFGGTNYRTVQLGEQFTGLTEGLLGKHVDHHYGDEKLIAKYGKAAGGSFIVGEHAYKVVVVPPSITWKQSTINLLEQFIEQGGTVLVMPPLPVRINGEEVNGSVLPKGGIVVGGGIEALVKEINKVFEPDVVMDSPDIMFQHRRVKEQDIYFFINTNREKNARTAVRLAGEGAFEAWDAHTGTVGPYPSTSRENRSEIVLDLPPVGSCLLVRTPGMAHTIEEERLDQAGDVPLGTQWDFKRLHPNALVMDTCQYRFEDGPWSDWMQLFQVQDAIRTAGFGVPFGIRYSFRVNYVPENRMFVVVENPEMFKITLNGQELKTVEPDYYWDWSFKKLEITGLVKEGENLLELHGELRVDQEVVNSYEWYGESFRYPAPFDTCIVIGDFSVEQDGQGFAISQEKESISSGDLTRQGYPFFIGHFELAQDIKVGMEYRKAFIELDGLEAVVVDVAVNGHKAGQVAWQPHRLEITDLLKPGKNRIALKLVNSLHNLIGPWHNPGGEDLGPVHWHSWRIAAGMATPYAVSGGPTSGYYVKPLGLQNAHVVLYR